MAEIARLQPVLIIASALLGIALGYVPVLGSNAGCMVEPLLILMLLLVFLVTDLRKIGDSVRNVRFSITALLVNFVWNPLFAFLLGLMVFKGHMDARIGLLMLLVTPCTDWYLVFTGIAKGNVPLGASILP